MISSLMTSDEQASGQIEQIATTFGVDWPHLIAQIISFSIVCIVLYRFAYRPILTMLEGGANRSPRGWPMPRKSKAELARTEAQRQEVMAQANVQANKLIEEARAAAARVRSRKPESHCCGRTDHDQGARSCRSGTCRMLAELKREVGRLVVQTTDHGDRQDSDAGRSAPTGGRNRQASRRHRR